MNSVPVDSALLTQYDGVLFDLDGVLYAGPAAIAGAPQALKHLVADSVPYAFVTNNASRSAESVAAHLQELDIPAHPEQVLGSAPAGVTLLASQTPLGARVLVIGSAYLRQLVSDAGFVVVDSADDSPQAVIQGFDPALGWAQFAEASYAINNGAEWFATNLDLSIPRDRGIAPGNGALVQAVAHATGTAPQSAGKPEPTMFLQAAEALGIQHPLVIGDRLDTDILGGNRAGFSTALVLTGVNTAADAAAADAEQRPRWILRDLSDLFNGEHQELS